MMKQKQPTTSAHLWAKEKTQTIKQLLTNKLKEHSPWTPNSNTTAA